jgi:hypothetical protein
MRCHKRGLWSISESPGVLECAPPPNAPPPNRGGNCKTPRSGCKAEHSHMRVLFPLSHLELHSRRRRVVPSVCRALPLHATASTSASAGPTICASPQTLARPPDSRALLQLAPAPAHPDPGWRAPSATCACAALCGRCTGVPHPRHPFASPFLSPGPSTAPLLSPRSCSVRSLPHSARPHVRVAALCDACRRPQWLHTHTAAPAHTAPYLSARSRRTSRPQHHSASRARYGLKLASDAFIRVFFTNDLGLHDFGLRQLRNVFGRFRCCIQ